MTYRDLVEKLNTGKIDEDQFHDQAIELIKEKLIEFSNSETDWSYAADKFVQWIVANNFKLKSFELLVDYILVGHNGEPLNDDVVWDFFFGYGDNFETFAYYWVANEEQESYMEFAKN